MSTKLAVAFSALMFAAAVGAQEEGEGIERDVGFSHNGYSYSHGDPSVGRRPGERAVYYGDGFCELCEIHRYDGLGLVYRGSSLDSAFMKTRQPHSGQLFDIEDDAGNPLGAVEVQLSRAGFPVRASGMTNEKGQLFVRLDRPKHTYRVELRAPGFRPAVYELTGGELRRNRHRVTLQRGVSEEIALLRFVPEQRSEPNREAARMYRRALRLQKKGDADAAIERLSQTIDLWPLAGGVIGKSEYTPYAHLSALLQEQGRLDEASHVLRRGLARDHRRTPSVDDELRQRLAELSKN